VDGGRAPGNGGDHDDGRIPRSLQHAVASLPPPPAQPSWCVETKAIANGAL
jgi:hypothetical protein